MKGWGRFVAALVLVIGGAVALALLGGAPAQDGPDGFSALTRFLRSRDRPVAQAALPPRDGIFFLPLDDRRGAAARAVADWVRDGGRLVVADPDSGVAAALGFRPGGSGLVVERPVPADCAAPAVVGVRQVVLGPGDVRWEPAEGAAACFADDGGAWLLEARAGRGSVVLLGGAGPLTNRLLAVADDATLAWNVLGRGGGVVTIGTPGASTEAGLWTLIPGPARAVLSALALALLVFALARGRRFGRAPREVVPSPIPATELVLATAELYRRGRAAPHGVALLQEGFRTRAARRLGVRPTDPRLPELVPGTSAEEVERALAARPAADERDLVDVGVALEAIERRMEGG